MHVPFLLQPPPPVHCHEKKVLGAQVQEKCYRDFQKVLACVFPVSHTNSWGPYAHGGKDRSRISSAESTQLSTASSALQVLRT